MEYALHGAERGAAVILSHGTGGGYDQGLMLARLLDDFQGIAVSRAGYLRTPIETGRSPADLADAYTALLDYLKIEKAAILGQSAGGMFAAQFALRYPDRCWALVLADAITKAPPKSSTKVVQMANALPDGVAWLMTRFAVHVGLPLMIRSAETRSLMRVFFENNPVSERSVGVQNDLARVHAMDDFTWEEIHIPTLLIHGDKDHLIPLDYTQEVSQRTANAELIVVPGGGHECLISRQKEVTPALNKFLAKHKPV